MHCINPTCSSEVTKVAQTIKLDQENMRLRHCPVCLCLFMTQENPMRESLIIPTATTVLTEPRKQ
jgi:hypothetical protein